MVRDPAVDVTAEVVLVVPRPAVAVIAVLALAPQRHVVSDPLGAAPQRHVPDVLERHRLDDGAEPVGVWVQPGIAALPVLLDQVSGVARGLVAIGVDLIEHRHVGRRVRHLGQPSRVIGAHVEARRQLRLAAAPALRRDEDDPVGSAGAVDRRGGVLQHAHALDVLRIETLEPADAIGHPVDHDERAVVVQRVVASDPDTRGVVAGLPAPGDRDKAGQLAGEGVREVDRGHRLQLFARDRADGTGESRLTLLPVSDRHDLRQLDRARP